MTEFLSITLDVLTLVIIIVSGLLFKNYLPSYFSKKGENLATREDVAKITEEVEKVKSVFNKDLEDLRVALSGKGETYKLVGKKRYEILMDLWTSSEALLTKTDFSNRESIKASLGKLDASLEDLNKHSVLISEKLFSDIESYLKKIGAVLTNSDKNFEESKLGKSANLLNTISPIVDIIIPFGGAAISLLSAIQSDIVPSVNSSLEKARLGYALEARRELEVALRTELGVNNF